MIAVGKVNRFLTLRDIQNEFRFSLLKTRWCRYFKVFANLFDQIILDFFMPRNRRNFSVYVIDKNTMITSFTIEIAVIAIQIAYEVASFH